IERSDGVTTISEYMRRRTVEFFASTKEIEVIHNFVNCHLYKPDPARRLAQKRLMHISNFREVKRPLDCVRILARVRQEVDAQLLMVGDGPLRSPAEQLARELGVEEQVTFLGKQDHVERIFPTTHVLLMPSELEAFGLAALEAMACGVPPVGTKAGGVPELITHGADGFIEGVGDLDAQSARAVELLTDDGLHHRMATAARHTAVRRFS